MIVAPKHLDLRDARTRLRALVLHAQTLEFAILGARLEDDKRAALAELAMANLDRIRELYEDLDKQLEADCYSAFAAEIERLKAARAASEAFNGPGDFPDELHDAEDAAVEALARARCADTSELSAKLRILFEYELNRILSGGADLHDGGSLAVAIEAYCAQRCPGWA